MHERLGLRRIVKRRGRNEPYEVEEERYDDLRDTEGMVDLTEYAELALRQREAYAYIDLSTPILEREAVGFDDEGDWPAA